VSNRETEERSLADALLEIAKEAVSYEWKNYFEFISEEEIYSGEPTFQREQAWENIAPCMSLYGGRKQRCQN